MSRKHQAAYLSEGLAELERAIGHLEYSAASCEPISSRVEVLSEEDLARVEAFTSRFARVVDLMTKRMLRTIDEYELYEPGTLLDVANRAEKRNLIGSLDWLRELRDTRNRISHDYAGERLSENLEWCRRELPELLACCARIATYGDGLLQDRESPGSKS